MCLTKGEQINGLWYSCPQATNCADCQNCIAQLVEIEYELAKGLFGSHGIFFVIPTDKLAGISEQLATFTDVYLLTTWHSQVNGRYHFLPEPDQARFYVIKDVYDAAMHRLRKHGRVGYTANM